MHKAYYIYAKFEVLLVPLESICRLIICIDKLGNNNSFIQLFPYKVIVDLNVLGPFMKNWIKCNVEDNGQLDCHI